MSIHIAHHSETGNIGGGVSESPAKTNTLKPRSRSARREYRILTTTATSPPATVPRPLSAFLNIIEDTMSGMPSDDATGQVRLQGDVSDEKIETPDQNEGGEMPSQQEQEASIKKKYGGIVPKKPPLISKDHERAFFDSADWALGKQGGNTNKPKGPLEALRPKLQPTQQQTRSRRSPYASFDSEEGNNLPAEDATQKEDSIEGKNKE